MQHVKFLQLPHVLFQGRVLIKVIQHVTAQSLTGDIDFHSSFRAFSVRISGVARRHVSHLHEVFDTLVVAQEVVAQLHPL